MSNSNGWVECAPNIMFSITDIKGAISLLAGEFRTDSTLREVSSNYNYC